MSDSQYKVDDSVIDWIKKNLRRGSTILELGSGAGTQALADLGYRMISIEQSKEWVGKYDSTYIHAPIQGSWYDWKIIQACLPTEDYDLILVDGPTRYSRMGFLEHRHLFRYGIPVIIDDIHRREELLLAKKLHTLTPGRVTTLIGACKRAVVLESYKQEREIDHLPWEAKKNLLAICVPCRTEEVGIEVAQAIAMATSWWHREMGGDVVLKIEPHTHVDNARNGMTDMVMSAGAEWVFWMDSDAVPSPLVFIEMWRSLEALRGEVPNANWLVPVFCTRASPYRPTIFVATGGDPYPAVDLIKEGNFFRARSAGFHTMLMHRDVIAAAQEYMIESDSTKKEIFQRWEGITSDIFFCEIARKAGQTLWCDPQIHVGHRTSIVVDFNDHLKAVEKMPSSSSPSSSSPSSPPSVPPAPGSPPPAPQPERPQPPGRPVPPSPPSPVPEPRATGEPDPQG